MLWVGMRQAKCNVLDKWPTIADVHVVAAKVAAGIAAAYNYFH